MPQIHFFNVNKSVVEDFYTNIDNFYTLANATSQATHVVYHNAIDISHPNCAYVKIEWMKRPIHTQESVKKFIEEFLKNHGFEKFTIHFSVIEQSNYYTV